MEESEGMPGGVSEGPEGTSEQKLLEKFTNKTQKLF